MDNASIEQLTIELHNFFNSFSSWESSIVRSSTLTVSENHAIEILGIYGNMNMRTLAEKLSVTRGTVTVTVDRLEKNGDAKRIAPEADRRSYIIKLTPKGKAAFEEHHKHHKRLTEELVTILGDTEARSLTKILHKFNEHLL
jgi:DNA-binding MarR family transcriptional regulator